MWGAFDMCGVCGCVGTVWALEMVCRCKGHVCMIRWGVFVERVERMVWTE